MAFVISPGVSLAKAATDLEISGFKLIKDTENESIYQIEEDGNLFEYNETVKGNKNIKTITTKKYIIQNNGKKKLIENNKTKVDLSKDNTLLITNLDTNEEVEINFNQLESTESNQLEDQTIVSAAAVKYQEGGSYIADIRYRIFTNGTAEASIGKNYKNTSYTNYKFRDFKAAADNIVSEEKNIITGGLAGIADAIAAAVRGGQMISMTLIKTIFKQAGKAIPVFGTLLIIYNYGKAVYNAVQAYKKI